MNNLYSIRPGNDVKIPTLFRLTHKVGTLLFFIGTDTLCPVLYAYAGLRPFFSITPMQRIMQEKIDCLF